MRTSLFFALVLAPAAVGPSAASAAAKDPVAVAKQWVIEQHRKLQLTRPDLEGWAVSDSYRTEHNGVTHVYLQQRLGGIDVVNGITNVNVGRAGRVLSGDTRFVGRLSRRVDARRPAISPAEAIERAAAGLRLPSAAPDVLRRGTGPAQEALIRDVRISRRDIPARLVFLPLDDRRVRLAWELQIEPDSDHYWLVYVDAVSGTELRRHNLVVNDGYRVYALPAESPNHASPLPPADGRTRVDGSAADKIASPHGWHDLNGSGGADTTDTTGNNVFAQTDVTDDDLFENGGDVRPSDPSREFDFPLDLTRPPSDYREAAVTNLFYFNNVVHDVLYRYGFDEAAGNFQQHNRGRGGIGGDPVQADAQDGSGTNNANMLTLPEGVPPRMQMFVWTGQPALRVDSPASIAGTYKAAPAAFGEPLDRTGVTGDIVLAKADDPATPADETHACEDLAPGSLTGKIALIYRGSCEFGVKVKNAEDAGAKAAIVANHAAGGDALVFMGPGSEGGSVTIPSIFVGRSTGTTLEGALADGVNGTMYKAKEDRDSDLDNGVIAHEYGHGVSIRLTGGPANVACLQHTEQGGEGWSDWWALVLTQRAGATGLDRRGIGSYVSFQDPPEGGPGIRSHPYTTDMAANPLTYATVKSGTLSVPHGIGTVWASALWDMHWALVEGVEEIGRGGRGLRTDLYDRSGPPAGNQVALQLVMDGLKMQPCLPTFLDARDAILAADRADFDGAHRCQIWWAFARRGMGVNAKDSDSLIGVDDTTDRAILDRVVADFKRPEDCEKPARTVIDDGDRRVSYSGGWVRKRSSDASAGGYHRRTGGGSSTGTATSSFTGDRIAFMYGRSDKGGVVEVRVDGELVDTLSQRSPGLADPAFDRFRLYDGFGDGEHTIEVRHRGGGAVYVDGFAH